MSEKSFSRWLKFFLGLEFFYVFCSIFLSQSAVADDFEHMHAAWLVWNGYIPYTDFFEHHHPLMWYLFAPIMGMANRNILIIFPLRVIMCSISILTLCVVYRLIKGFLKDRMSALLTICIFASSLIVQCSIIQIKPDMFMHLFFMLGLYYFFKFIRDEKQKDLNICAIMMTIGFLFLQTIIFLALPLGVVYGYLLIKKKATFKMLAKAIVVPTIILGLAVAFLYYSGNLERYWQLNWVVNSLFNKDVVNMSKFYAVLLSGFMCAIYLIYKKPNIYVTTILLMYFTELALRTMYFSVHIYYFKMLLLYNAIVMSLAVGMLLKEYKSLTYIIVFVLAVSNLRFFLLTHTKSLTDKAMVITMTIAKNTTADDIVLNMNSFPFGVFNKDPHYYWFSWSFVGDTDAKLYHYAEEFDINKILVEKRPKFVYYEDYLHRGFSNGDKRYDIDIQLLLKYYEPAGTNILFKRKMKQSEPLSIKEMKEKSTSKLFKNKPENMMIEYFPQ